MKYKSFPTLHRQQHWHFQGPERNIDNAYALWYSREHMSKTDKEEKKLLNKVVIFVFFVQKKVFS